MAVLTQLLSKLKLWDVAPVANSPRIPSREENLSRVLGKVEPYVVFLQRVLIWENPKQSVLFLLALHGLFWFVVQLELRFFFIVFGALFVFLLYKVWVDQVQPEIHVPLPAEQVNNENWTQLHPRVLSAPELSHHLNQILQLIQSNFMWLQNLRQEQPGLFCCIVSCFSLMVMWIGWAVSGTTLLYCTFMSLFVAPGVFIHLIPSTSLGNLFGPQSNSPVSKDNDSDSEEYLLNPTASDMVFLHQACEPEIFDRDEDDDEFNMTSADFQNAADDMTDSGAPSLMFLNEVASMPAPEDLSLESTDLSFALPNPEPPQSLIASSSTGSESTGKSDRKKSLTDADLFLSDSDDSVSHMDDERIHFRTRHFKKDSSSEEEISPSRGESHKIVSGVGTVVGDAAAAVLSYSSVGALNLASLGAAVGQTLISSVISSSNPSSSSCVKPVKEEEDILSDTDDFEMISEEEYANL